MQLYNARGFCAVNKGTSLRETIAVRLPVMVPESNQMFVGCAHVYSK